MRKKVEHALGLFRFFNINRKKRLTLVLHFQLEVPPSIGGRKRYLERKKKGKEKKQQKKKLVRYTLDHLYKDDSPVPVLPGIVILVVYYLSVIIIARVVSAPLLFFFLRLHYE
jgi:hypothetical protein